jgi:hypothetical protein
MQKINRFYRLTPNKNVNIGVHNCYCAMEFYKASSMPNTIFRYIIVDTISVYLQRRRYFTRDR